jgi:hypothetical protein
MSKAAAALYSMKLTEEQLKVLGVCVKYCMERAKETTTFSSTVMLAQITAIQLEAILTEIREIVTLEED